MAFKLAGLVGALDQGGFVRYDWLRDRCTIVLNGSEYPLDGRTYQAFLHNGMSEKLTRHEIGSVEHSNLIIEWR